MAIFTKVPGGSSSGIQAPVGDIGGTNADPLVDGFKGIPLVGTIAPGQLWVLNGAGTQYVPYTPSAGGSGTVTTVSVASANGFGGTVATPTTTPAITITTSVTGLLKGNGTGVVAGVAGTDYVIPSGLSPYAPLASPALTGVPTAPTATAGTTTTQLATTAFVTGGIATAVSGLAPLASPALTGTPTAPTATVGTNTTQIATTAFVLANAGSALAQIAHNVLGTTTASVTFSSIPGTYNHLKVMAQGRCNGASSNNGWGVQLNADSTAGDYDNSMLQQSSSTLTGRLDATNNGYIGSGGFGDDLADTGAATGIASMLEVDIFAYAQTTFFKNALYRGGYVTTLNNVLMSMWKNTVAVTSITIICTGGASFIAGSAFYLYGVT